ncbi:GNAT family N-acetyltransferase [Jiella sp. KSK16Y-1]|uniref:GNAT family N-acetyltransferase n=2 Tax=Jiella mangrovi TaxID=2821407 RepID=A0ABS4BDT9_9HYPH|nr:GNAT family N-acetyltransferase [Jiella mangrovi]MBP0614908.1 GNAT family N-acetyltransferase [Jiella mangrovi]
MRPDDLAAVCVLADRVHPGLREDPAIFAERLALYPAGCFVLERRQIIAGYAIAHPIRYPDPPSLNMRIGSLPPDCDALYIHDVALSPEARGEGQAGAVIGHLLQLAAGFPRACLVSVYGTAAFWQRFGFSDAAAVLPSGALSAYGEDARFMQRLTPDCAAT